jgi:hypothetical protein
VTASLDLPPTPTGADPVIVPGLLSGLGITPDLPAGLGVTRRPVPAWITNPDVVTSIALGLVEVDDEFMARDEPTLPQIEKRLAAFACFYLVVQRAYVAHLEQRVATARLGA